MSPPTPPQGTQPLKTAFTSPPQLLRMYDEFIAKNSSQVAQIESALRSLTYIIPGRFRDAEIASETVHSSVQLLSLYHDNILLRASHLSSSPAPSRSPSTHTRYTRHWIQRSSMYRRVALLLQVVTYTELVCEMAAKRRGGERLRWRVVVVIQLVKTVCRLLLLYITSARPIMTPALPERPPIPESNEPNEEDDATDSLNEWLAEEPTSTDTTKSPPKQTPLHEKDWTMPRTGMRLPSLPTPSDISSYLLSRVLTADEIRPATRLLNQLRGTARAAEILHILSPLIYTLALMSSRDKKSWTPWLAGVATEYAARQLRDRSLRTTALEREEWARRGWGTVWWAMRGAFYENVTKGVVGGVRRRMPSFVSGIMEDYEYLWENYFFATND